MPRPPSPDPLLMNNDIVQARWITSMPIRRGNKLSLSLSRKRKEGHYPPSTSDTSDTPSPLRRFVKRLRGESNTEDALSENSRPARNGMVWSLLARRRKPSLAEEVTTGEDGHRIVSWINDARIPSVDSRWSGQTYTASRGNSIMSTWSPDSLGEYLKALAQDKTSTTGLFELADTSPAELPNRVKAPVDNLTKYTQPGQFHYQQRGLPPASSSSISGSTCPERTVSLDGICSWSSVVYTETSDAIHTAPEDSTDGAYFLPYPAHLEASPKCHPCEVEVRSVPSSPGRPPSDHDVRSSSLSLDRTTLQAPQDGLPPEEPKSTHHLPDGALNDSGATGSPQNAMRLGIFDRADKAAADCNTPTDSRSYMAGEDVLESREPTRKVDNTPESVSADSLVSVEELEEGSSSDSSSIWLSDYSDDIPTLPSTHPNFNAKNFALRMMLAGFEGWQKCPAGADGQANGTGATTRSSSFGSSGGGSSRKRQRKPSQSNNKQDKSQLPEEHRASTKRRRTATRKVTFACPYSKKDPMGHRDCYKYMLTRIRDVKQHLGRCHRRPMYCPRCYATFETEDSRDNHILRMDCMPTSLATRPDGITEEQRKLLSQKSLPNHSKEDQWFAIWDVLFPDTPRPASPYIDSELLQDITLYQDFLTASGPQILSDVLAQRGAVITWSTPNGEQDSAASQQNILEEGLRVVFDEWAGRNGMSRQPSTATSSSSGSAPRNTPPSSGSAATNESQPPRPPFIPPQTDHTARTAQQSHDVSGTGSGRTIQTNLYTSAGLDRLRVPDIIPDLMRQAHYTTAGQPVHRTPLAMHALVPPVGAVFPDGPYVPGFTPRAEEHSQYADPNALRGGPLRFEEDDLLIYFGDDSRAVTPSVGFEEENSELMRQVFDMSPPFVPPENDFRGDVG